MEPIKSQIAKKFQIPVADLVAVLYYSDRSYTSVTAYGTHLEKIAGKLQQETMGIKMERFTAREWTDLKVVPEGSVADAAQFGLPGKMVLLVSGYPPTS